MEATATIPIFLDKKFKDKIDWLVLNFEKEIAGFIIGKIDKDGILCEDLLIYEQEADVGSVEVTPSQLINMRKEHGDLCKKIIGQFHSHNTMSSFWSSDDEEVIKRFAEPREISLFIVGSTQDGHLLRVEIRKPFNLSIDGLGYKVKNDELGEELLKIIKEKVKKPKVSESKYDNWKDKGDEEIKKEAEKKIKFFNKKNRVVISELSEYVSRNIENEYQHLKPICKVDNLEDYTLTFKLNNKDDAKKFMKNVKDTMSVLMEIEDYDAEKDAEKESNIPSYEEVNRNIGRYFG